MLKSYILLLLFLFPVLSEQANAQEPSASEEVKLVKLIDWARLEIKGPETPQRALIGKILLNANKYALTNWWEKRGFAGVPLNEYLDLKGVKEHQIRPIAAEAEALATSLRTGLYDPAVTGVSTEEAQNKTLHMIRSLANAHLANKTKGWGKQWQSSLWAGYTAIAAWKMWDKLEVNTQIEVLKMIKAENEWIMSNKGEPEIVTFRDRNGKIIRPGNTGAEENAWDGYILAISASMMPEHPQHSKWMHKLIALSLNAMARPSDVNSKKKCHGKPLNEWLVGSNFNEDGTVVNHGFIHPDYMTSPLEFNYASHFWLSEQAAPKAAQFNTELVFHALADLNFHAGDSIFGGRVQEPGGTIYKAGSGDIFYPLGTDWGTARRMNFVMFNCVVAGLTKNKKIKRRLSEWILKQGQTALDMQNRFADGHTYLDKSEDRFASNEEWVANKASTSYISETIKMLGELKFTNKKY